MGNTGLPDHGSQQFLAAATRFLSTCDVEQIRLAPDKCKYPRAPLDTARLSGEQDCSMITIERFCSRGIVPASEGSCCGSGQPQTGSLPSQGWPAKTSSHSRTRHTHSCRLCPQVVQHDQAMHSASLWPAVLSQNLTCSCLQAKHYNAAALVLDQTILDVEPAKTSMKPTDLLLYCYYGGMIHIGER